MGSLSFIVSIGFVLTLNGCGSAPTNPLPNPPKPTASATPAQTGSAPAVDSTAKPSSPAPYSPEAEPEYDKLAGTLDADTLVAPCDFTRHYRGKVGDSPVSVLLVRKEATLSGTAAYDAGVGQLAISGKATERTVDFSEHARDGKPSARFEGTCAPETGIITGTWTHGQKSAPLVLKPRANTGIALVERRKVIGNPNAEYPSCHWDVRSPAVFGLGDDERQGRINSHLRVRFLGMNEANAEKKIASCPQGTDDHVTGWYSIEANEQGLLSVVENGYTYFGPAAHGDHTAASAAISIDIPTGRLLDLTDIVKSSKELRPLVTSCMKIAAEEMDADEWWLERDIQGVPTDKNGDPVEESSPEFNPSSLHAPSFLVLPDGIAVLIRGQPTVSSFYELQGPVIRWGALLRASVVKPNSLVARLWAGVKPIGPQEPSCVRFFKPKWAIPRNVAK